MDDEEFERNSLCENIAHCMDCSMCTYCEYCSSCNTCKFCFACNSCNDCYYSKGLSFSEKMIFCLGHPKDRRKSEGYQKHFRIFNKDVPILEYVEVLNSLSDINIYKYTDTLLDYEDAWASFWENATQAEKDTILNIPQFDKNIFKIITEIDVEV